MQPPSSTSEDPDQAPGPAVGSSHFPWVLLPLLIALLVTGYFELPLGVFGPDRPLLSWTSFAIGLVLLSVLLLREIRLVLLESDRGRPAVGIILVIFLSLVIFATAYLSLARHSGEFHGLHTRMDALYFTVITVSTVGYGDVSPAGQAARAVVVVQILYNFVFLAAGTSALTRQIRGRVVRHAHVRSRAAASGGPGTEAGPGSAAPPAGPQPGP
jgi:voltage-gated potassium channel